TAEDGASVDAFRGHRPFRGRQAVHALATLLKEAVPVDMVEDRGRCHPADRVVPGRNARLEHDPLLRWSRQRAGTAPESEEQKNRDQAKPRHVARDYRAFRSEEHTSE